MTPEAQRIAIAESVGWKKYDVNGLGWMGWIAPDGNKIPSGGEPYPDYLNDLNACAEFEATLYPVNGGNVSEWSRYVDILICVVINGGKFVTLGWVKATAPQRCEAYLRTIGKWTENEKKKV